MKDHSVKNRLRYAFDNTMSKGTIALITYLGIFVIILVALAGIAVVVFGINSDPEQAEGISFIEGVWVSLMRTLDAGTMGGDQGWGFRLVMFGVTVGGIFIVSSLIGLLSAGIEAKLGEMRKGRSTVVETGHQIILGWSPKVHTIISEIVEANTNQKKPRIVILADKDKVDMEDEIRSAVPNTKNTRVICRTGNPNSMADLKIVSPEEAKSIIIISGEAGANDSSTIKTILALTNDPARSEGTKYHIIAEMDEKKNLEVARMVGGDEVELIYSEDVISRLIVQTCRQSGLSVVYMELMQFEGDEIYFVGHPSLTGKTFAETLSAFETSSVIGVRKADGSVLINPPMDTRIDAEDLLIGITEDDDTFLLSGNTSVAIDEKAIAAPRDLKLPQEKSLIIGWNSKGEKLIREMNNYVGEGSSVTIAAHTELTEEVLKSIADIAPRLTINYQKCDTTEREILENMNVSDYDHIIVISYDDLDLEESDSQTLITLLHLRNIADVKGIDLNIVSEMLDMQNRELAEVTKADDFIVSNKLLSLLMSQVSENKELMRVFEIFFDAEGSEIYLKPIDNYVKTGVPVSFYTVLEAAKRQGQAAFGYRIAAQSSNAAAGYGIKINPKKSGMITFAPEDSIIVLAED